MIHKYITYQAQIGGFGGVFKPRCGTPDQIFESSSTGSHRMASLIFGLTCSIPSLAASVIFSAACRSTAWTERNPSIVGFVLNQRDWLKGDGKIELIYTHIYSYILIYTHIILMNDVSSGTTQIHKYTHGVEIHKKHWYFILPSGWNSLAQPPS